MRVEEVPATVIVKPVGGASPAGDIRVARCRCDLVKEVLAMGDKTLQESVMRELAWEPRVDAARIGVSARDGAVTLSGEVASYSARTAAVRAAERIHGVRAVADELKIALCGPHTPDDAELAEAASRALRWSSEVPETIDAEVKDGFITLTGTAAWHYERAAAMRAVRDLRGVVGVANTVRVESPQASPVDVEQHIRQAFERAARLDARQIEVSITDRTAHLHGCVRSIFEKHVAENAAASAPGVDHIDDRLLVLP
jgi:osmotically-inducible protein OsmY